MPASTTNDELPYLTNEDVEILYLIVTTAQSLPGLPFRALFTAYDSVLTQHGIDKSHDRIYFNFLLRMCERPTADASLYSRFEELLSQMGIQVNPIEDGDSIEGITRNLDHINIGDNASAMVDTVQSVSRRASFDNAHSGATDRRNNKKEHNVAGRSRHGNVHTRSTSVTSENRLRERMGLGLGSRPQSSDPQGARMNLKSSSEIIPKKQRRNRSVSSRGSLRIRRDSRDEQMDLFSEDSEPYDSSIDYARYENEPPRYIPPHMLWQPSDTQMLSDADTFLQHQTEAICRRVLQKWHDVTLEVQRKSDTMTAKAEANDRITLLQQGLDQWRMRFLEKRQIAETERFFEHLERRAGKARDLFLLTKAFTHWAQSASDEVMRTSVARRHILRTKYFNAWKEITAVNELKVRRQGLRKFFDIWRRRSSAITNANDTAIAFYEVRLMKRVYWTWFFQFCDRRAPLWSMGKAKAHFFNQWLDITRQLKERERLAAQIRAHDVQRRAIAAWVSKVQTGRNQISIAAAVRRRTLLMNTFSILRRQMQLRPLATQLAYTVDTRLVRTCFSEWLLRTRQAREAETVCQLRIMRNAWTNWNDGLRCRAVTYQIDSRLKVEMMYKWVLAHRASLLQRVHGTRLLHQLFNKWHQDAQTRTTYDFSLERRAAEFRKTSILRVHFSQFRSVATAHREHSERAHSVYAEKISYQAFHTWTSHFSHLQQLNQRAEDARFYVLTKHTLDYWRGATQHAQRLRRREAYATIRRKVKMSLVRRALLKWQEATAQCAVKERHARDFRETKLMAASVLFLTRWRDLTGSISEQEEEANNFYRANLLKKNFARWTSKYDLILNINSQAEVLYQEIQFERASTCLKKMSRRIFQIERHADTADVRRERNLEKRVPIIFQYWVEKTAAKSGRLKDDKDPGSVKREDAYTQITNQDADDAFGPTSPSPLPRGKGSRKEEGYGRDIPTDVVPSRQDWHVYDDSAFDLGNMNLDFSILPLGEGDIGMASVLTSTPLPGYLRTPSKRSTVRAKARERYLAQESAQRTRSAFSVQPYSIPTSSTAQSNVQQFAASTYGRIGSVTPSVFAPTMPASAPPGAVHPSPSVLNLPDGSRTITSFDRKMQAQGVRYSRLPRGSSRRAAFGRTRLGSFTPGGFENIVEDEGSV